MTPFTPLKTEGIGWMKPTTEVRPSKLNSLLLDSIEVGAEYKMRNIYERVARRMEVDNAEEEK